MVIESPFADEISLDDIAGVRLELPFLHRVRYCNWLAGHRVYAVPAAQRRRQRTNAKSGTASSGRLEHIAGEIPGAAYGLISNADESCNRDYISGTDSSRVLLPWNDIWNQWAPQADLLSGRRRDPCPEPLSSS